MTTAPIHFIRRLPGVALALACAAPSQGATITLGPGQSVQAAIGAAQPGDRIELLPGSYHGAIDFLGKAITVVGVGGATATTLDGTGLGVAVVTFGSGEGNASVLEGVTVTGGLGATKAGGGIRCQNFSGPLIRHCRIVNNVAAMVGQGVIDQGGGGLAAIDSGPRLEHCQISANSGPRGGGVLMIGGFGTMLDCVISANTGGGISAELGGGLELRRSRIEDHAGFGARVTNVNLTVSDCLFARNQNRGLYYDPVYGDVLLTRLSFIDNSTNEAAGGGGLFVYTGPGSTPPSITLDSCEFARNMAPMGAAAQLIAAGDNGQGQPLPPEAIRIESCTFAAHDMTSVVASYGPGVWFHNSIVRGSAALFQAAPMARSGTVAVVSYSNIEGGWSGIGNFDADPLFADPAADDFRLRAGSPCVDAGDPGGPTPAKDIDGNDRDAGGSNDVGCDERRAHLDFSAGFVFGSTVRIAIHGAASVNPAILFLAPSLVPGPGGFGLGVPLIPIVFPAIPPAGFLAATSTVPPGLATLTVYGQAWTGTALTPVARLDLW